MRILKVGLKRNTGGPNCEIRQLYDYEFIYTKGGNGYIIHKNKIGPRGQFSYNELIHLATVGQAPWELFPPDEIVRWRNNGSL